MHLSPAEQMQVEMEDRLSGVRADVIHGAISALKLAFAGELCRDELAIANQFCIGFACLIDADNMLFRHDENMRRRSRLDVFKGKNFIVFVNFFRRNAAGDDLAEEAVGHNKEILAKILLKSRPGACEGERSILPG